MGVGFCRQSSKSSCELKISNGAPSQTARQAGSAPCVPVKESAQRSTEPKGNGQVIINVSGAVKILQAGMFIR